MIVRVMKAAVRQRLIRLKLGFIDIWKESEAESKLNLLIRPEQANIVLHEMLMKKMRFANVPGAGLTTCRTTRTG